MGDACDAGCLGTGSGTTCATAYDRSLRHYRRHGLLALRLARRDFEQRDAAALLATLACGTTLRQPLRDATWGDCLRRDLPRDVRHDLPSDLRRDLRNCVLNDSRRCLRRHLW